jgi:hypothetical protein
LHYDFYDENHLSTTFSMKIPPCNLSPPQYQKWVIFNQGKNPLQQTSPNMASVQLSALARSDTVVNRKWCGSIRILISNNNGTITAYYTLTNNGKIHCGYGLGELILLCRPAMPMTVTIISKQENRRCLSGRSADS